MPQAVATLSALSVYNYFVEMSCFPYIFDAFSADLSGSHSVPSPRRLRV
jgi:hypothetical protein